MITRVTLNYRGDSAHSWYVYGDGHGDPHSGDGVGDSSTVEYGIIDMPLNRGGCGDDHYGSVDGDGDGAPGDGYGDGGYDAY